MNFSDFNIKRLNSNNDRPLSFKCSDSDLNEFFFIDSIKWDEQLLAVTYLVYIENKPVSYFSISNDAIKKENLTNSKFKKLTRSVPYSKRYNTMPAVKIGRLATGEQWTGNGIGTFVINFIKAWFTKGNKTGCRFIIVDAYNNDKTIRFYEKNGFTFLLTTDTEETTRLMVFDLFTFKRSLQ